MRVARRHALNDQQSRDDIPLSRERVSTWVESSGGRLAVYLSGGGQDAVILLHGGPGVPDYLGPVAEMLGSSHSVVRYDQRGTGHSATGFSDFGLDDQVQDLEAIRAALGHERIGLFGHSWGGTLAQLYQIQHPSRVSSLFLSNSGIGLGRDWKEMERAVMSHNRIRGGVGGFSLLGLYQLLSMFPGVSDWGARKLMSLVWRNYFDPPSSAPLPDPDWLQGVRSAPIHMTRRAALDAESDRLRQEGMHPDPRVLVLFGAQDIYGPTARILFDRFPNARHVVLDPCGHVPWLQDPEAFRSELCNFFDADDAQWQHGA